MLGCGGARRLRAGPSDVSEFTVCAVCLSALLRPSREELSS